MQVQRPYPPAETVPTLKGGRRVYARQRGRTRHSRPMCGVQTPPNRKEEPEMPRQIALTYQPPSTAALEARIRDLETRVAHLTALVEALTHAPASQA
ncbi:hypothetical protein Plo01_65110 [Planobispora longispora]|uniref:Uncharacterized protein n=1 Tax=Planobispora longispora TaxID=28887 RepID=A0A8J3RUF3_9ACTN|nr:hypothetical protein GCM10020093_018900 [Planobispora longispora]GIH80082.1 hypothetical protein Plo01_65110 [Planobispora longispora]